jgi:hypothetical protein
MENTKIKIIMKKIILKIFQTQSQIHLLHWQTTSYAEHQAFGGYYEAVDGIFDTLVEAIQGKYGRIFLNGIDNIQVADYPNLNIKAYIDEVFNFFDKEVFALGLSKDKDGEIVNIIQEILDETNKLKYLLTLK